MRTPTRLTMSRYHRRRRRTTTTIHRLSRLPVVAVTGDSKLLSVALHVTCLMILGSVSCSAKWASRRTQQQSSASVECQADGSCQETTNQGGRVENFCTVYMAPSTLGEETSLGIYTAIDLHEDDVINYPEIAVPLLFREFGDHVPGYDDGVLWDRYIWEGDVMDIETYIDTNRDASRSVFVPGVGCTVNSVLDMNNIDSTSGSTYTTEGLHRSRDPGAGAFTPYHGSVTKASQDIVAGSELFASYGDYWIPDIPGAQISLEANINQAEDFLRNRYYSFIQAHDSELTDELKQALWEFASKDFPVYNAAMTNLPRDAPWSEVESVLKQDDEEDVTRHFLRRQSTHSLEWLQENGYCQDHMTSGRSTIPQAGRGSFASRDLPAGTVVGYAPLIHIGLHGRDIWTVEVEGRKQYDLILNYSFGHANSTVLLTPYGAMVNYINHGGKVKANVKLRWPNKDLIAHKPHFLDKSPDELANTVDKIGLSFEYIAIRDIQEGEEIFLDYGMEWEEAWNEHVKQWEPVEGAYKYVHSTEWQEETYRTLEEQENDPYPENLHTMCLESYTAVADGTYHWVDVLRPLPFRIYCDVLRRSTDAEGKYRYQIQLTRKEEDAPVVIVNNVPEDGVFLYDRAFSADWHLPNAFRHEIMIPDDIMPEAWMNGPPPLPEHAQK